MQRFLDLFISKIQPTRCNVFSIYFFYKFLYMSQAVPAYIVRSTELYIERQVLSDQYCCYCEWDGRQFHLIHDSSSIGLTIPDAVCTVLCSWWWAEEPPETCRTIYRNKQIKKTLHLVGCTLEIYWRCMDIWTSKLFLVTKPVPQYSVLWNCYMTWTTSISLYPQHIRYNLSFFNFGHGKYLLQ